MMVSVFTERVERAHQEEMIDVCVKVYVWIFWWHCQLRSGCRRSHLRRGVMGNFRYRSWKQLRPVTTLITIAEHEYVVENDMYALFYPHTVAMLRYPGQWIIVYGENQKCPLGFDRA